MPKSYWKPSKTAESVKVDFGEVKDLKSTSYYFGLGVNEGSYKLSFSQDAVNWTDPVTVDQKNMYNWNNLALNKQARYVELSVVKPGGMINELAFLDNNDKPYEIKEITAGTISDKDIGKPQNVFDEQSFTQKNSSYKTGMYFDEIYHARTAFEQLNGITAYETTHPPLGKIIISAGVAIFGMDPFGWRVAGAFFGILLIPLIYLFAKKLFKKTEYAFIAAFIMAFDAMHFTQSRIATIDIFAVFFILAMYYFMYMFTQTNIYKKGIKKSFIYLALCGLSFGLGVATKWICVYAAFGLAIIFFIEFYDRIIEYKYAQKYVQLNAKQRNLDKTTYYKYVLNNFRTINTKVILWCVLVFIAVPIVVYILSYIPFLSVPNAGHGLSDVLRAQTGMFDYHSKLVAEHPYSSNWYEWPFIGQSLYYYTGAAAPGKISQIWLMGNPAIWWVGAFCALAVIVIGIVKKDKVAFVIVVGGLSQFIPWMLVPRLTFLYHYFATLPFVMLCIVYICAFFKEKYKNFKYVIYGYLAIVLLLFILFYPIMSAMEVGNKYIDTYLKWFTSWSFTAN